LRTLFALSAMIVAAAVGLSGYYLWSQSHDLEANSLPEVKTGSVFVPEARLEKIKKREQEVLGAVLLEIEKDRNASKKLQRKDRKAPQSLSGSSVTGTISGSKTSHKPTLKKTSPKPKLVIIIDDMAFGYQVEALKRVGLRITPSFFPPSPRYPHTHLYAKELECYMVHLPMEAMGYGREEYDTLFVDADTRRIEEVIRKVRRRFPKAKYINNHTGSKFTADYEAMRKLVEVLGRYGFGFVDSRTTAKTRVPDVMREFGFSYLHRDIFLDNEPDPYKIRRQLKKAIRIAKRRGWAIAIGHPRKSTFEALRIAKDILKEVQLVYIDEL